MATLRLGCNSALRTLATTLTDFVLKISMLLFAYLVDKGFIQELAI
jgi:hypothetical protein